MPQYDAFISYNSREANQVHRVAEWLREQGVQVFLDKWELRPGDKLVKTLGEALAESDCCVVMIGENGISPWHENEIYSVLDATIDRTMKRVIPVFLPGTNPPAKKTELPWFLRGILYVTFERSVEEKDRLQEIKFGITGLHQNGQTAAGECPYRGLEVFREKDRMYFYGREALVQQLYSRLENLDNNRLLAVLGPSGSGKSSVAQAGLIPQLENDTKLIRVFTPANNPIEQLAYALRSLSDPKPNVENVISRLANNKEALHLISGELTRDQNQDRVILIVDQFEELFTLTEKEEWVEDFIDLLIYAVEVASGPTHVVLTMRSDFLGRCAKYPRLNDYVSHHIEQVGLMNVQELRDAIEQPAWKAGLTFEAGLVDSLLRDVKNAPGKLPLLQFALKELYNQRHGNQLTHQTYQALGGIEGALARRADAEYQKLPAEEQLLLKKIFLQGLIQPGEGTEDTRRRASKQELYGAGDDEAVETLIQQWSGSELRLLSVSTEQQQGDVVEVAHEALIRQWDRLARWIDENREQVLLRNALRREALEWEAEQQDPAYLPQGSKLARYEELYQHENVSFTKLETAFVEKAVEKRDRLAKRVRVLWGSAFGILVVFLSVVGFLYWQNLQSSHEISEQLAQSYWNRALSAREEGNQEEFLILAAAAMNILPNDTIRDYQIGLNIQDGLQMLPTLVLPHNEEISGVKMDILGDHVLSWSQDSVWVWSLPEGQLVLQFEHGNVYDVSEVMFNQTGDQVLSWGYDNIRVWSVLEGQLIQQFEHRNVSKAMFNQTGDQVLSWGNDSIRVWSAQNGQLVQQFEHREVSEAMFNQTGDQVLSWGRFDEVQLWSVQGGQLIQQFEHREVSGAMFNQTGDQVLSWGGYDGTRLWSVLEGLLLRQMDYASDTRATFNQAEDQVISYSVDGIIMIYNIAYDYDCDPSLLISQLIVSTRKRINEDSGTLEEVSVAEWQEINQKYQEEARAHLENCKYPHQNIWAKHYPQQAQRIRSNVDW